VVDLEHDPEKWTPVFGEDHAQMKNLDLDPIQPKLDQGLESKETRPLVEAGFHLFQKLFAIIAQFGN
jgi:hypothetical protein